MKYSQKFRDEWFKDPMLSRWIVCKSKRDRTKVAEYKYCRCELGNKYSDLGQHRLMEKHKTTTACAIDADSAHLCEGCDPFIKCS